MAYREKNRARVHYRENDQNRENTVSKTKGKCERALVHWVVLVQQVEALYGETLPENPSKASYPEFKNKFSG